jgi:hypothetical protein
MLHVTVGDNVKGMLGIPEKRTHQQDVAEKMLMYLLVKPSVFS